ncbi:MAG: hypothetical protein AAFU80_13950 [Pseudomonadota bacterium]
MKFAFAAFVSAVLAAPVADAEPAGLSAISMFAPHHQRAVEGAVFYPTLGEGAPARFGANAVFEGVDVREGALLREGRHPIVLLSHGLGGNIRTLAWLAAGLAQRGAVVMMLNHPNSTTGDYNFLAGLDHGTRAQDLSIALEALIAEPSFAGNLDTSRVMAAGFSYGGWTALSLGGVTGNLDGYIAHCEAHGAASSHCADILNAEVSLSALSPDTWNTSYADPRVTHVAAIDPGLVWGLDASNVAELVDNVRLISLGDTGTRLLATDVALSGFAALLPHATVSEIAPAAHFTALPPCTDIGAELLAEEGDDPVCTDPARTDRRAVHAEIIDLLASDLGL